MSDDRLDIERALLNWLTAVQRANGFTDEDVLTALRSTIDAWPSQGDASGSRVKPN